MTDFSDYLSKALNGQALSESEMIDAMTTIMKGAVDDSALTQFLIALADRGETEDEIAGAARVLRGMAQTISAPPGTIDCCGTGGDGLHTFNISTAVALVAAGAGVSVAKHGNRAASSKSGAADVLESLGMNLALPKDKLETALHSLGFCFLMAPNHHLAMKHVMPVRRAIGRRTIFNLLGPLANPAGTTRQLIGVFDKDFVLPMARALQKLGSERAWVVHSDDGLDEISLSADTHVAMVEGGAITQKTLTPEDFGLPRIDLHNIIGGDAQTNAKALSEMLKGQRSPYRDIVLANASAVMVIAGKTDDLKQGVTMAAASIDSGRALHVLNAYKDL